MSARVVVVAAIAVLAAGCGSERKTAANRPLANLHDISQLRAQFNAHAGEPRLVVLVSPT